MRRKFRAVLYRSRAGWRWKIYAANGRKVANGGEAYRRKIDALGMLTMAASGFGCETCEVVE
jgi:uncharacterized protein YegP (UPF0339 family)